MRILFHTMMKSEWWVMQNYVTIWPTMEQFSIWQKSSVLFTSTKTTKNSGFLWISHFFDVNFKNLLNFTHLKMNGAKESQFDDFQFCLHSTKNLTKFDIFWQGKNNLIWLCHWICLFRSFILKVGSLCVLGMPV